MDTTKIVTECFSNPGYFIEIGAWDGEHISQTVRLEREFGWTGVCVDPFPRNFEHRTCRVCASALSAAGGKREFVKVTIDRRHGGDVSYFSGFRDSIERHWPLISENCDFELMILNTITPSQLFERFRVPSYVHFLSIDTEGSELEILRAINHDLYRFGLIMIEHNNVEEKRKDMAKFLDGVGYGLYDELVIDDVFIDKSLEEWALKGQKR